MRIKRFYESTSSYKEFNLEDECRHILDNDSNCWVEENSFVTLNKLGDKSYIKGQITDIESRIEQTETFLESLKELNILYKTFIMRGFTTTLEEDRDDYILRVLDTDDAFKVNEDSIEVNKETLNKRLSKIIKVDDIKLRTGRVDKLNIVLPINSDVYQEDIDKIKDLLFQYSVLKYQPCTFQTNDEHSHIIEIWFKGDKKLIMK